MRYGRMMRPHSNIYPLQGERMSEPPGREPTQPRRPSHISSQTVARL